MGFLDIILRYGEDRRRRQSLSSPLVGPHGRDSLRNYKCGRSVVIDAWFSGEKGGARTLYLRKNLTWEDSSEQLSESERNEAYDTVREYLRQHRVPWDEVGEEE